MHGFPTGCATSCTFGKRSFTGSFNARACDWQGIRKSSVFWKQERQEGCFQARFLMSSSSVRIPWDMLSSQQSYYKVLGRFSSVLIRVVDSGSHSPFRAANLSWKWRITRVFLPMCPIPFQKKPAPALDIQSLSACSHRVVQQSRCSMVLYVVSPYPPI